MERLRRLHSLWNWLPGFRAVAETEHLPQASRQLHISSSALSRTIRLLEEDVGQPLFNRVGRNLELNTTGSKLLSAVRDGMRLIDEALASMTSQQFVGPIHISCAQPFLERDLLPVLTELRQTNPALVPYVSSVPGEHINAKLLRGQLDVAFSVDPVPHEDLTVHKLKTYKSGVYCGAQHKLWTTETQLDVSALQDHAFVAPEYGEGGRVRDHWPTELPRKVGMYAELDIAIRVCAQGHYLAVLPDGLVLGRSDLRRLPVMMETEVSLYATQRKSLGFEGRAELLIESMRAALASDS